MNILHYFLGFPPYHSGGLMVYARDLALEQQINGHKVIMLMPGRYSERVGKTKIKFHGKVGSLKVYQILNGLPFSTSGMDNPAVYMREIVDNNFEEFFIKHNVQVLHVHSLIALPKALIDKANELQIRTIFSVHDYFGICPKLYLLKYDNTLCTDYKNGIECVRCNANCGKDPLRSGNHAWLKTVAIKLYQKEYIRTLYRFFKSKVTFAKNDKGLVVVDKIDIDERKALDYVTLRNYYMELVEKFKVVIFNSSICKSEYGKYVELSRINNKIIHVTHKGIQDKRDKIKYNPISIDGKIVFAYMGYLERKKGFFDLIEVMKRLKNEFTNWKLVIYGDCSSIDTSQYDSEYFVFNGKYKYSDLERIFSNVGMVIIPSKCKETFGFIGLEALSCGIPVMTSDIVGLSDLIENGYNGVVYSEDDDNKDLYKCLYEILNKPAYLFDYHFRICDTDFDYEIDKHYDFIKNVYFSD